MRALYAFATDAEQRHHRLPVVDTFRRQSESEIARKPDQRTHQLVVDFRTLHVGDKTRTQLQFIERQLREIAQRRCARGKPVDAQTHTQPLQP